MLVYEEKSKTGTEHNPQFCFEAMLDGNILGRGVGQSKKQAKFFSAQNAYETIKMRSGQPDLIEEFLEKQAR